jgi:hypothetical protein
MITISNFFNVTIIFINFIDYLLCQGDRGKSLVAKSIQGDRGKSPTVYICGNNVFYRNLNGKELDLFVPVIHIRWNG